jgi:pantetheine-phosphate adenylyltransferase
MMKKIAVFPGSFDPFTIGHESIINRALPLFDEVVIMIGINQLKKGFFSVETRKEMIEKIFAEEKKVRVAVHTGLTVDFCQQIGATYLLRGLRTAADFEYERAIAQVNKKMFPQIETIFLLTMPEHTPINSSIVRDILYHGGDASMFIPKKLDINNYLRND